MISIIVCSANAKLLAKLRFNIDATIGIAYELLVYDNRQKSKGIAEVYNQLASEAVYNILCFVHEDVIIHTNGWGVGIKKILSNKDIGLLGISGAVYKSKYPGTWSACDSRLYRTNSIQHFKNTAQPVVVNINPDKSDYAEVAVIDGVFMATRKDVFNQYKFDSELIKGFHGYDIDYSFQVGQQYQIVVSYGLLLEHLSEGILSEEWLNVSVRLHNKWMNRLYINPSSLGKEEKNFNDYLALKNLLTVALKFEGHKGLVLVSYYRLLFLFGKYNRFQFSKSVLKYLLQGVSKSELK
jgi:hypothetical protein